MPIPLTIPAVIHYCWFGQNSFSPLHEACMATWKKHLPNYEFVLWNEDNAPMDIPYIRYHYSKRNWAFVSDYVRLHAIYTHGGIYLDVDFEIVKNLDPLRTHDCFLGEEYPGRITNGICGGIANHVFFAKSIKFMEQRHAQGKAILTSPEVCTKVYNALPKDLKALIYIFGEEYFYPYNPFNPEPSKQILMASSIKESTIGGTHGNKHSYSGHIESLVYF